MERMTIHSYPEPTLESSWREGLAEGGLLTHYTMPEFFLEPFPETERPFAVLALEHGRVQAIMTGVVEHDQVCSGKPLRSQTEMSGTADARAATCALAEGILEEARGQKFVVVHSRTPLPGFPPAGFRAEERPQGNVVIDLRPGSPAVFARFDENRRRNVRAAMKTGVEIRPACSPEQWSAYYDIYVDWCGRKGVPSLTSERFLRLLQRQGNRRLLVAFERGRMVAGIVVRFYRGGLAEYAAGASYPEAQQLRCNDLLHWHAIQWACSIGCTHYSLGGVLPFHRRFGGAVVPMCSYEKDLTRWQLLSWSARMQRGARAVWHALPGRVRRRLRSRAGIRRAERSTRTGRSSSGPRELAR